jgi:hypothetical protein
MEEVGKLKDAGFIREVLHPNWLANLVLVLLKNNHWRMCIAILELTRHHSYYFTLFRSNHRLYYRFQVALFPHCILSLIHDLNK